MILFIVLGLVVLIAVGVLGVLFYMLSKEKEREEQNAVPVTDFVSLKRELSPEPLKMSSFSSVASRPAVSIPTPALEPRVVLTEDPYKKRVSELEEELRTISQKADGQSNEARQMITDLTRENEALKSQQASLEQAQQKLIESQGEAFNLKSENNELQLQLDSANTKARLLEEEMTSVKLQLGEEISRANATITELNHEKENLLTSIKPETEDAINHEMESLKIDYIKLQQKYEAIEKEQQGWQYELIKAKAQSSGLERVSFNYKNQLEDFFKKMNMVQETNDQLSQAKNRLEGIVLEIKLQNEELSQKDQLTQFELDKNRSRLLSLEREYEDLKARVQQQNQG